MQPEALTTYLNEYFSLLTRVVLKYGATIDKYIGDAMMVFFGDLDSKGEQEDARSCVAMAMEMQEELALQKPLGVGAVLSTRFKLSKSCARSWNVLKRAQFSLSQGAGWVLDAPGLRRESHLH